MYFSSICYIIMKALWKILALEDAQDYTLRRPYGKIYIYSVLPAKL